MNAVQQRSRLMMRAMLHAPLLQMGFPQPLVTLVIHCSKLVMTSGCDVYVIYKLEVFVKGCTPDQLLSSDRPVYGCIARLQNRPQDRQVACFACYVACLTK